jgi:hypothetical protein
MKTLIVTSGLVLAPLAARAATTYVYSIPDRMAANAKLNADGWGANDNWIAGSFNGSTYARHNVTVSVDDTIFRANDGGFGFTIPTGTTRIILTIAARTPNFWEAGLAQGTTSRAGIGGDFNNSNKFYIFDNSSRIHEVGTSATADVYTTLTLDFDLIAGTADLILDPEGANTLLLDDVTMGIPTTSLTATNGLYIRTGSRFTGPQAITLTVIPEPASVTLGGLGALALLLRRRRR